ncbi:MAG: tRNA dihydrouridine(20/20a) synthase DusA, partial [Rhizobacter sp.]|nr:tRNA dihydrouridine(20/20a) synthase DusA [Rhizobacter sp.]
ERFHGAAPQTLDRAALESLMVGYMERVVASGEPWSHVSRHILGLWNSTPGARKWRQVWSDHKLKAEPARVVSDLAHRRELSLPA